MDLEKARHFIAYFMKGEYSPEEYAAFLQWLEGASVSELGKIADEVEVLYENLSLPADSPLAAGPSAEWIAQLENKLDKMDAKTGRAQALVKRIYPFRVGGKGKWVAAASLAAVCIVGGLLYSHHPVEGSVPVNGTEKSSLNTAFIPRGGQQQEVVLPDGSKVWLNVASSLKYPPAFAGGERMVELSGEAFFDVAKNADKPFVVKIKGVQIEVLGTHFNVMAYEDEPVSKTTLIEGAVRISGGVKTISLEPGEQAQITYPSTGVTADLALKLVHEANPDGATAWKNGFIEFTNDDLQSVMRKIARYYDVKVQYEGIVPALHFTGDFSRKDDLQTILKQLELHQIHYKVRGSIITVTP